MNLTQLRTELGAYLRANQKQIRPWIYQLPNLLPQLKKVTKIKGRYPAINSVITHVVQGFQAVWNPIGTVTVKVNELKSFHQKVNFKITPSEIENSWIAELNDKNLSPEQRPISQYIIENELKPRVVADLEDLLINGIRDENNLATYGKSMDGLLKILNDGINNVDNPMYRLRLAQTPDTSNIVDVVTEFEKKTPNVVRRYIKKIYMSTNMADDYALRYEDLYGLKPTYSDNDRMLTRLRKWEIIPLDEMDGSNIMFATPEGNFLALVDDENPPAITDIQVLDYDLKVFMEFWLGIGFYSNQMVIVSTYTGGSGLVADNDTYYA
jgi:hypothetical protein